MPDQTTPDAGLSDDDRARITPREERLFGAPPRIPPMSPDEFTEEMRESTRALRIAAKLPPDAPIPDYVATALRHPTLYRAHTALAILLMSQGALRPRDRELAVLRTGWLCAAPFEWGEHVAMGKRVAGLTSEEIARVRIGSTAPGWDAHDHALLRAVEELREDAMISDATWATLAERFDERQLLELPILVGQYMGVAFQQNSLRVRMLAGNPGLNAR